MQPTATTIDNKTLYKNLTRIVLPIAVQYLITSSLSLVDNLMVGRLGEEAMASVGAGSQMFSVFWGILFGFCSASSAFMSQFWGSRDLTNIRRVIGFCGTACFAAGAIVCVLAFTIPETLVSLFSSIPEAIAGGVGYLRIIAPTFLLFPISMTLSAGLRSTQQTRLPLVISLVTFGTNTCLNYLLIFGKLGLPRLGVNGAATATLIARCIEITLTFVIVFAKKNVIAGPLREFFSFGCELVKRIFQTGVPVMANETLWSVGQSSISAMFGRMTVIAYSSFLAANTIEAMFLVVCFSMADAVMILVGQKLGEGDTETAFELAKKLNRIGALFGLVMSLLMFVASPLIVNLYNMTPEGLLDTKRILYVQAACMTLELAGALIIVGALRCGGDTKAAAFIEVGCLWAVSIPLVALAIFVLHLPVYFCVAMYMVGQIVKFFIARRRFQTRKWCRTIISGL